MTEQWHCISRERDSSGATVLIRASATGASLWFSGHFPGNPILPGLAILAMVKEAIVGEEIAAGRVIQVLGIRRVRFRQPVKPNDTLTLSFSRSRQEKNLSFTFQVFLDAKAVCSGMIAAGILSETDPEG